MATTSSYAWHAKSFFRLLGGPPPTKLVVEDLDGDGKKEIIAIFAGKLHVIKTDGTDTKLHSNIN